MIPGIDLLDLAFSVIDSVAIPYYSYATRDTNDALQWVAGFNEPFDLEASVQRVPRNKYTEYGLEFQRNYVQVYASAELLDLERDTAGDQFIWGGRVYQIESQGTWFLQDGWASCLAVDIGPATTLPNVIPAPTP